MRKLLSTTIIVGLFASTSLLPAYADIAVDALPKLDSAINADVTTNGSNMNVQINAGQGGVGTINWGSFNVGKDAGVNYEFTAHNQTALNKVDAAGGLSQIYGKITSSGCSGCGYDATGKVILLNPNGVLFGDGANVNLNSFTVSTMNGTFDAEKNELQLDRNGSTSKYGIMVEKGANIYGDKGVTFASDNVSLYNGSKISTNIGPNVGENSFGKIKIVTSDGVNFAYYNNGAVKEVSGIKAATDKMVVSANGELESGNIDIRNYSSNVDSEINLNGAALKATKAVKGNDGNIWLTASNKVVVDNSDLTTTNYSDAAAAQEGGNIRILAGNKSSVTASKFNSVGKVEAIAQNGDSVIDNSTVTAAKDVNVTAGNIASIQKKSTVKGNNVNVVGAKRSQVHDSTVIANEKINVNSDNDVWFYSAKLKAGKEVNAKASKGYILAQDTSMESPKVNLDAATNVTGNIDLKNSQANIYAGNDIDLTLANVGDRNNDLVAKAGHDMTINTDGDLAVSSLISGNDMTLNAKRILSGNHKTSEVLRHEGDSADRAYIEVGGKFTSNPDFEVTDSAAPTEDGLYNKRHHIQYEDGTEKILLVNKRPVVNPPVQEETVDGEDQAQMLNKLPRQPETYSNVANITDGRTTFVDVFAAASQIEIVDDEEE